MDPSETKTVKTTDIEALFERLDMVSIEHRTFLATEEGAANLDRIVEIIPGDGDSLFATLTHPPHRRVRLLLAEESPVDGGAIELPAAQEPAGEADGAVPATVQATAREPAGEAVAAPAGSVQ